ncbi:hypothetical protein B0G69_3622 [Paraburkholderia sp. RAU2J]|nr:hypothetical protein B0G69_3622 [Paraburkholderia sp. RAU2J]
MRVATKGILLASALMLNLSGAVYAQGAGTSGGGAPVQAKVAPEWERRMQTALPRHHPARPAQTPWVIRGRCRRNR